MKVKLVQDSIIFISGLKKTEYEEAMKFVPSACTLTVKNEATKTITPVCALAYAAEGSVSDNGIVFDSVTDEGYMCKTLVATLGFDPALSAEDKEKVIAERFAGVILKMNDLEAQVKDALAENADKIAAAKSAIETVNI